jgi:hypothetical protein
MGLASLVKAFGALASSSSVFLLLQCKGRAGAPLFSKRRMCAVGTPASVVNPANLSCVTRTKSEKKNRQFLPNAQRLGFMSSDKSLYSSPRVEKCRFEGFHRMPWNPQNLAVFYWTLEHGFGLSVWSRTHYSQPGSSRATWEGWWGPFPLRRLLFS